MKTSDKLVTIVVGLAVATILLLAVRMCRRQHDCQASGGKWQYLKTEWTCVRTP